jgi:hypothetical protein
MNIEELAIKKWGVKNQILKTIEELGELSTALARYLLYKDETYEYDVIDEIADCQILLDQLRVIFPEVGERVHSKRERLAQIVSEKVEYREMRDHGYLQRI